MQKDKKKKKIVQYTDVTMVNKVKKRNCDEKIRDCIKRKKLIPFNWHNDLYCRVFTQHIIFFETFRLRMWEPRSKRKVKNTCKQLRLVLLC